MKVFCPIFYYKGDFAPVKTSLIVSAKKSESKIAQETIEETFGAGNQLVVMVSKGDYESEHKVVKKTSES